MALGDGTGWNENAPVASDPRRDGADEIRDLRLGVRIRLNKEHVNCDTGSVGGEHEQGSAKAYYDVQADLDDISTRPDGEALTTADHGRLGVSSDQHTIYGYIGSAWKLLGVEVGSGSFAATGLEGTPEAVDTGIVPDLFVLNIPDTDGHTFQYVVLLRDSATVTSMSLGGGSSFHRLTFALSSTTVTITHVTIQGALWTGTAYWMAFRFPDNGS